MNILMVTSSYPKFPGDVTAPFIESMALALAARGHAVDIVLPHHPQLRRGEDEPVRFFPYRYAPSAAWSLWGYAQSLEADVRVRPVIYLLAPLVALSLRNAFGARLLAKRYDAVHVHWVLPNAALVADIARRHGAPLVISLHGSDVFLAERLPLAGALARRAFDVAGSITACSADLQRRALALGAAAERTHTVPYGVDVDAFSPHVDTRGVRERLGVPGDAVLVLAVGRIVEKKGFEYLVEAAALTRGAHFVIAGDGTLRGALERRARALRAPVTFSGNLERRAVAAALAAADVAVVPSIVDSAGNVDGLPNALLEALAAGCAVVATNVAGIPDVVQDDEHGLLVPQRDPRELAEALNRLVREPETRERLGREGRRMARERLSWDAAARAFEGCYGEATALETR